MPEPMRVLIQMKHSEEMSTAARAFSPIASAPAMFSVPGCRMDMGYSPVQLPHRERREVVGEREVGRLFHFNATPEASTYLLRGEIDDFDALSRLEEAVKEDPLGMKVFADPKIATVAICPPGPIGSDQNVETLLHTTALQSHNLDGSDVLVAVVDTGINMDYIRSRGKSPNFDAQNSWKPPGVSGTVGEWELPPLNTPQAGLRHGTMCAYDVCIAAPNCTLLDIALLRSVTPGQTAMEGFLSDAIQAYSRLLQLLANSNPKPPLIVNNSWGMYHPSWDFPVNHPGNYSDNPDHPFNIIVESLDEAGADILFAAGNCGEECPDRRCEGVTNQAIYGANSHDKVLCIAGVTVDNERVGYSSKGPGRLAEEKPDFSSYTHFIGSEVFGSGAPDSGTSTACPVAAGVIAAIRTARSVDDISPASLRHILRGNSEDLGAQGYDFAHGHGVMNVPNTLAALGFTSTEKDVLPIGQEVSGNLRNKDDKVLYHFKLGEKLNIVLDGPTGADFDLYVRKGLEPTIQDYDQRGYTPQADELVKVEVDEPGDYYVMVHSYEGAGEFKLKAELE